MSKNLHSLLLRKILKIAGLPELVRKEKKIPETSSSLQAMILIWVSNLNMWLENKSTYMLVYLTLVAY
jgi:hypothetical protein